MYWGWRGFGKTLVCIEKKINMGNDKEHLFWIWTSGEQKTYRRTIPNSTDTDIDLQRGSPLTELVD